MFLRLETLVPNVTKILHTHEDRILNALLIGLLSVEALIVLWVVLMGLLRRFKRRRQPASPSLEKYQDQDRNPIFFAPASPGNVRRYQHVNTQTSND